MSSEDPKTPEELLERFHKAKNKTYNETNVYLHYLLKMFGSEEAIEKWIEENNIRKAVLYEMWIEADPEAKLANAERELAVCERRLGAAQSSVQQIKKELAEAQDAVKKIKSTRVGSNNNE